MWRRSRVCETAPKVSLFEKVLHWKMLSEEGQQSGLPRKQWKHISLLKKTSRRKKSLLFQSCECSTLWDFSHELVGWELQFTSWRRGWDVSCRLPPPKLQSVVFGQKWRGLHSGLNLWAEGPRQHGGQSCLVDQIDRTGGNPPYAKLLLPMKGQFQAEVLRTHCHVLEAKQGQRVMTDIWADDLKVVDGLALTKKAEVSGRIQWPSICIHRTTTKRRHMTYMRSQVYHEGIATTGKCLSEHFHPCCVRLKILLVNDMNETSDFFKLLSHWKILLSLGCSVAGMRSVRQTQIKERELSASISFQLPSIVCLWTWNSEKMAKICMLLVKIVLSWMPVVDRRGGTLATPLAEMFVEGKLRKQTAVLTFQNNRSLHGSRYFSSHHHHHLKFAEQVCSQTRQSNQDTWSFYWLWPVYQCTDIIYSFNSILHVGHRVFPGW